MKPIAVVTTVASKKEARAYPAWIAENASPSSVAYPPSSISLQRFCISAGLTTSFGAARNQR